MAVFRFIKEVQAGVCADPNATPAVLLECKHIIVYAAVVKIEQLKRRKR